MVNKWKQGGSTNLTWPYGEHLVTASLTSVLLGADKAGS